MFWLLYSFFWQIPRYLNFMCQHSGTLCLFHLHRWCKNRLWKWNRQRIPICQCIKLRCREVTQKKEYNKSVIFLFKMWCLVKQRYVFKHALVLQHTDCWWWFYTSNITFRWVFCDCFWVLITMAKVLVNVGDIRPIHALVCRAK